MTRLALAPAAPAPPPAAPAAPVETIVLRIERRFALLVYRSRDVGAPHVRLRATAFVPALPSALAPGRTRRGTFGGRAVPPRGTFLRVLFGRFSASPSPAPAGRGSRGVTEHAYRLRVRTRRAPRRRRMRAEDLPSRDRHTSGTDSCVRAR